jgi:predicted TIM-barrel fold metal-dependent hydrolase
VNSKLLYASNAMSDLIMTGVLERYPRLKFVLVENEVSWIPFFLTQYDKYWGRGNLDSPLKMLPSEYFVRQFYATFFNDPPARSIFDAWETNNLMWSNDYPIRIRRGPSLGTSSHGTWWTCWRKRGRGCYETRCGSCISCRR